MNRPRMGRQGMTARAKMTMSLEINRAGRVVLCALMAAALSGCRRAAEQGRVDLTWENAVGQLVQAERLARLDGATVTLASSYDPAGGNNDFNHFKDRGSEPGWVTLVDESGPGCIRRLWMTGTDPGHPIRIIFDGERRPRVEGPVETVFGETYPWVPPLAQYVNMCFFSYVPLTFNRSIRIETREPNVHPIWGQRRIFYQASIEKFDPSVRVETYPAELSPAARESVERVRTAWTRAVNEKSIEFTDAREQVLAAGGKAVLLEIEGPAMLAQWQLRVDPREAGEWNALDNEHLLQDAVLRVYYDRAAFPSIEVPLGDFFGNAWRKREYGSLLLTSSSNGFACRFPVPFKEHIRLELENGSDHEVVATIAAERAAWPGEGTGYLHAEWRRSGPTGGNHTVADLKGRGKFAGCFLGVTGLDPSWWILEGDERMWVDDGKDAYWRGTGLEDYFNGGWYYRGAVFHALSASFDRSPFRVAQFRHQLPDAVSFNRSFRMEFERMTAEQGSALVRGYFQSVAYFYMDRPSAVAAVPADRAERRAVEDTNHRTTFMLQLVELERMNDFRAARRAIDEYAARYPDAEELGVYRLRQLEYRRLMGEPVGEADYQPFIDGLHGVEAQKQARLLQWFYQSPTRALVGMHVNGKGTLYLNGAQVLAGDHPYHLFVTGVDLSEARCALAAEVEWQRQSEWFQAGLRTHTGVTGTGPGTYSTRSPGASWMTGAVGAPPWHSTGIRDIPRGVPDAPFLGGIANAFVLLQSKSYPVSTPDWMYYRGRAFFRHDAQLPLSGWPAFSRTMTGLQE